MNQQQFNTILSKYENTDTAYYEVLSRVALFCSENFFPILQKAEAENKKVYLKRDSRKEAEKLNIHTDGTIYLDDLDIR